MEKTKISRPEAYSRFNEEDFTTMNKEIKTLFSLAKGFEKEQSMQFFYIEEKEVIILEVYWDGERVQELIFS